MVTIRPATRDDVEHVIALRTQAFNINEHGRDSMRKDPRVEEVRVFYDVSGSTVEVLAIVPKSEAESWLAQFASPR